MVLLRGTSFLRNHRLDSSSGNEHRKQDKAEQERADSVHRQISFNPDDEYGRGHGRRTVLAVTADRDLPKEGDSAYW